MRSTSDPLKLLR